MAATNYRDEMMYADEEMRKRRKVQGPPVPFPLAQPRPTPLHEQEMMLANESRPRPAPAPLPTDGRIINSGQPRYQVAQSVNPGQPGMGMNAAAPTAYATPKPAMPPMFKPPQGPPSPVANAASASPAAPAPQGGFAGMGDRRNDMDPELLVMNDTEQGRRDLAMLRKQRNLTQAAIEGSSNQYSKFYDPNQTGGQRSELILAKEGMNQQLGTAERAANPPRYADTPGKSSEQLLYEETARTRQQQAVGQANADQGVRNKARDYQMELDDAVRNADLNRAKTQSTVAKAEGATAEAMAANAGVQALDAKAELDMATAAIPDQVKRDNAMRLRASSPVYAEAVAGIGQGVRGLSGKGTVGQSATTARQRLNDSVTALNSMPPELQNLAAAEIMANLAPEDLDLPKEAFQDDWFGWIMNTFVGPAGWGIETPASKNTTQMQQHLNKVLGILKDKAAKAGVNPQVFNQPSPPTT